MKNRKNYLKFRKKLFKWKLIGFHSGRECSNCGQKTVYQIYKYDAWCCISCNEWLDATCEDPKCPFCSKRPVTPYEAYCQIDIEAGSAGERKHWRRENYQHKVDGAKRREKHRRKC